MVGKNVRHPIVGREIPIIADAELVDTEFGTGAVKVTPAHDFNDFETGMRHKLPMINILDLDGTLNENAGPFAGPGPLRGAQARCMAELTELGLLRGASRTSSRWAAASAATTWWSRCCRTQWFVKIEPLAKPAIEAVEQGQTQVRPRAAGRNTYSTGCATSTTGASSRQLWWGHQIPAWYCGARGARCTRRARATPAACAQCGGTELDAGPGRARHLVPLGPVAVLDARLAGQDAGRCRRFYPTRVMETGYDIIFFWVARMMMMGLHFMGEVPFRTVLPARDGARREGREDVEDERATSSTPLDASPDEATARDALRFTLALMRRARAATSSSSLERVAGYHAFANKLWNAARFALDELRATSSAARLPLSAPR